MVSNTVYMQNPEYLELQLTTLTNGSNLTFDLYKEINGKMRLYKNRNYKISRSDLEKLSARGVKCLYIPISQKKEYHKHLKNNLGTILLDETIPLEKRVENLTQTSITILNDVFENPMKPESIKSAVDQCSNHVKFALLGKEAQKSLQENEVKAPYALSHAVSVSNFSILLALSCGMNEPDELSDLGVAALLHEIGKSVIDPKFYTREDDNRKITNRRFTKYPIFSKEILEKSGKTTLYTHQTVLEHQERLDGSGFPRGLDGKYICEPARIVAICDCYDDAINSDEFIKQPTPFKVLRKMLDLRCKYDIKILIRFIQMLGNVNK